MQVQTAGAPIAAYPGTLPAQTQVAVIPQVPQPLMVPNQQIPNSSLMYATAPANAVPAQAVVPQVVQPEPAPLMSAPATHRVAPGAAVAGQTDLNTGHYGMHVMQQMVHVSVVHCV